MYFKPMLFKQTTNGIFHRTRTKNFTICMEIQKTPNSQSKLEKEKQRWRNQAPWIQTILQSYSNQDSMVLAQKQKYRSIEQDRNPRHKPMHHIFFLNLWLCWVFVSVRGLSLVAASGDHSSSPCVGLSLSQPLLLQSTGSRCAGSVIMAHGPSCSVARSEERRVGKECRSRWSPYH